MPRFPRPANLEPSLFEMRQAYAREQARFRQQPQTCEKCGAPVVWIQMGPRKDKRPGGRMICDSGWKYGDGKKTLIVLIEERGKRLGKMVVKAGPDIRGFEPHWGSCPNRADFKRGADQVEAKIIPFRPSR